MKEENNTKVYYLYFPKNERERLKELIRLSFEYRLETQASFLVIDFTHSQSDLENLFDQMAPTPFGLDSFFQRISLKEMNHPRISDNLSENELLRWDLVSINLPQDCNTDYKQEILEQAGDISRRSGSVVFLIGNVR